MARSNQLYHLWALATACGFAALDAAPFAMPAEGPVAFRRDRLPMDVDTLVGFADDLWIVAAGQSQESPEGRRKTAQMLALSLALNPVEAAPRELLERLQRGELSDAPAKRSQEKAKARLLAASEWLEKPANGNDAQALGVCLSDVLFSAEGDQELGAWKGWIPSVAAYSEAKAADQEEVIEQVPEAKATVDAAPVHLALETASIASPLWVVDPASKQPVLGSTVITMKAAVERPQEEAEAPAGPMRFSLDRAVDQKSVVRINRILATALAKQFGKLPPGVLASLDFEGENGYAAVNRNAISAAAAVLMSAAISGKEPIGTVIGEIDESGDFKVGPYFWDQLRSLSAGPGGRLVIPKEGLDYLPSVLALEDPDFFLKYEVLVAANLTELLERSAKEPIAPLAETLAKFQDLRSKAVAISVGQYVTNRFVRQRLSDLAIEAPSFASPHFLAIQGAGERPTRVLRRVLASELRKVVQPLREAVGPLMTEINLVVLDKSNDSAREQIDRLDRYAESADREMVAHAREVTVALRTLSRARRTSVNRENGYDTLQDADRLMRKTFSSVIAELGRAAGEVPAEDSLPMPE